MSVTTEAINRVRGRLAQSIAFTRAAVLLGCCGSTPPWTQDLFDAAVANPLAAVRQQDGLSVAAGEDDSTVLVRTPNVDDAGVARRIEVVRFEAEYENWSAAAS